MRDGLICVAAGTPSIRVGDCAHNGAEIVRLMEEAQAQGVKILVLPELCLTGYTCGDLFLQDTLLEGALEALRSVMRATEHLEVLCALGMPLRAGGKLYNCAVVIQYGQVVTVVPKTHIPNYGEFYEQRWFASGEGLFFDHSFLVRLPHLEEGWQEMYGASPLMECPDVPGLRIGVELCEDLWVSDPPSRTLAEYGATVILNLSASNEIVGKSDYRRNLVVGQSGRLCCGYVYADAGEGESTTDLVFSGHNMIAENGALLAERRFETGLTIAQLDIGRLYHERQRLTTFQSRHPEGWAEVRFTVEETRLTRPMSPTPFVPQDEAGRAERCQEILTLAALGLKKRLEHTHAATAVVGLSGGLDSTLALLITARAFEMLGRDKKDILAITMPCFGTTARTRSNAEILAGELGCGFEEVNIGDAVRQHFADIGQSMEDHSVTFENGQARERTQVLMDIANRTGGLVIGTGDLSELALGWATYNGDHMSMYAVNASIPKTLVRHLVDYVAQEQGGKLGEVLQDILDTPVSPELLPPKDGEIAQKTEDLVGPYELHDFFLYYAIRWGFSPRKVFRLAFHALGDRYDKETLHRWLGNFYRRFFAQQFKRSCLPDGPKVGSVTLSPRGDWRMPSDAVARLWLDEWEELL